MTARMEAAKETSVSTLKELNKNQNREHSVASRRLYEGQVDTLRMTQGTWNYASLRTASVATLRLINPHSVLGETRHRKSTGV